MKRSLKERVVSATRYFRKRGPDFYVGGKENPYLERWWIIPRNPIFNIYLHKFLRDDDDRALHDHPWLSLSIIIKGSYIEHLDGGKWRYCKRWSVIPRRAVHRHRIELLKNGWTWVKEGKHKKLFCRSVVPAWTIFITGPRIREWGFWCKSLYGTRFVHWEKFTSPADKGQIGQGCGE